MKFQGSINSRMRPEVLLLWGEANRSYISEGRRDTRLGKDATTLWIEPPWPSISDSDGDHSAEEKNQTRVRMLMLLTTLSYVVSLVFVLLRWKSGNHKGLCRW